MKRFFTLFLGLMMLFSLVGCNGNQQADQSSVSSSTTTQEPSAPEPPATEPSSEPLQSGDSDTLVVYFSMPETTNPDNMTEDEDNSVVVINGEVLGNTQYVAYVIREHTGADIFRIEPETPYPIDHDPLVDLAAEEKAQNARPAMAGQVENMEQYDTIFVGYPNWWGDMPMILYSFFDAYDLSGKTIIPFNTHGGSGFSNTIHTIGELEPEATVIEDGYTVSRNNVQESEPEIHSWLTELGFSEQTATEAESTPILIEIDGHTLTGELDNSELAQEFASLLPQTISMQRVGGGREFYGSIDGSLNYDEADSQTTFENGDIAYWYSGNGLCLLYDNQVAEPEVESGIIIMGKITSDFSVLHDLPDQSTATITLAETTD